MQTLEAGSCRCDQAVFASETDDRGGASHLDSRFMCNRPSGAHVHQKDGRGCTFGQRDTNAVRLALVQVPGSASTAGSALRHTRSTLPLMAAANSSSPWAFRPGSTSRWTDRGIQTGPNRAGSHTSQQLARLQPDHHCARLVMVDDHHVVARVAQRLARVVCWPPVGFWTPQPAAVIGPKAWLLARNRWGQKMASPIGVRCHEPSRICRNRPCLIQESMHGSCCSSLTGQQPVQAWPGGRSSFHRICPI